MDQATLDRALVKKRSGLYDKIEQFGGFGKADLLASFALFDDDPGKINQIEAEFRKVTPELIQKTAQEVPAPDEPHGPRHRAEGRAEGRPKSGK